MYVWLVLNERVIESALAYFLAPLVAVGIGVVFFGERIRAAQFLALILAAVGVVVQGLALGAPPWMALALCATWSTYAVIRKRAPVPAATGLLIECVAMAPVAAGIMIWAANEAPLAMMSDWRHGLLLALAGPVTALPLMAFTFGARRVSFTTLGLLQFLAPSLQFATGLLYGEPFTPLRAASFVLIWAGLGFFSWDTLRRAQAS
jgi:chloramphenicol-sensitive protein RarD